MLHCVRYATNTLIDILAGRTLSRQFLMFGRVKQLAFLQSVSQLTPENSEATKNFAAVDILPVGRAGFSGAMSFGSHVFR
jgi:hypothetical protein